jgi:hypothetical protein
MVALKLVPRENDAAKELFRRFRLTGYPTLLFLTANGEELDRFGDFMPPDDFLAAIDRIRQGDTFAARLARLDETPGDLRVSVRQSRPRPGPIYAAASEDVHATALLALPGRR